MFAIKLLSRLPFSILYALSDLLFFLSYHVVKYRRKLVWKNLKNSFPSASDERLRKIEKDFYKNLCDYAVELVKLLTISKEELALRVKFTNPEVLIDILKRGQSVLCLASHQFNWEWLLTAGSIVLPEQMDFVYQPVHSKFADRFSYACRTRFGAHGIKRDTVAREVIKRRNILRKIALVGDQYPGHGNDKRFSTTFMHQPTVFFSGLNQLASITQYPVVYFAMRKIKRGYYQTKIVEIAKPPFEKENTDIITPYVAAVEKVIQADPAGWLWSHNRWKTRHLNKNFREESD
jgi:Kdo2-lipid IVA lauroyltransferase/acyltransferase